MFFVTFDCRDMLRKIRGVSLSLRERVEFLNEPLVIFFKANLEIRVRGRTVGSATVTILRFLILFKICSTFTTVYPLTPPWRLWFLFDFGLPPLPLGEGKSYGHLSIVRVPIFVNCSFALRERDKPSFRRC